MANWKEISLTARANARLAARLLKEKNRRLAAANRLRTAIRCEERAAEKEYLALGRYYYNALRDPDNPVAEAHCLRLDQLLAQRDSALESLEQMMHPQDEPEASSIAVIGGADGPTATFVTAKIKPKRPGALFHFDQGPVEITVTRNEDAEYDPEDPDSEEFDLSDVKGFDQDPMPEDEPSARGDGTEPQPPAGAETLPPAEPEIPPPAEPEIPPPAEPEIPPPAELDENDGLPFE